MNDASREPYRVCLEHLLELEAPSRVARHDTSLYNFAPGVAECAASHLGWTCLCSKPPTPAEELSSIATGIRNEGLEAVVLFGQGGSSQASMTVTKLHEVSTGRSDVAFRTMDSLSPVFVNHILGSSDPARTLYIVASKSGSTIEPRLLERVAWEYVTNTIGVEDAAHRFVAITDPGTRLELTARAKKYRLVLNSPVDVGGRFSALSVFSLFPAALVGIDIVKTVSSAQRVEASCVENDSTNPALDLACFLYANYCEGRDKVSLVMPPSGQVFGLWIEQLVAESLGKDGVGILPNVEVDASILSIPRADRCSITYTVGHSEGFNESLENIDESIPARHYVLNTVEDLYRHFIIWEYAIAFLGILLKVNPFNQPDVDDTKRRVRQLLHEKCGSKTSSPSIKSSSADKEPDCLELRFPSKEYVRLVRVSPALLNHGSKAEDITSVDHALRALLESIGVSDYFSLNAFLPFRDYGRREALERMRNRVASRLGAASCLEIGPRYLHSTGQLHKGGPNTGVFLYLSADEETDIETPGEDFTLGDLAAIQAQGDFEVNAARGRRAVQVHLDSNDSETLSRFADRFCSAISAVKPVNTRL